MLIYGIESAEQRAHAAFAVIADALFNFLFRALEIIRKEFDTDKKEISELEFRMSGDTKIREESRRNSAEKIISALK